MGQSIVIDSFIPIIIRTHQDQLTWVAHMYSGGRQCDPSSRYTPPNIAAVLGANGIMVYETKIESGEVCAACDCPSYAGVHFALIRKADLARAEALGFTEEEPPQWL